LTLNTSSAERRAFLSRLRIDFRFLLRHLPGLTFAVYRKIRNRAIMSLASPHRGRKSWPAWVGDRGTLGVPERLRTVSAMRLPAYPRSVTAAGFSSDATPRADREMPTDPEDLFSSHRWNFLQEALFAGAVDWDAGVARCLLWIEANSGKNLRCWEPYSACERIGNLLVFLAMMPPELREREIGPQLPRFLFDSINWIYGHLEYYGPSETNNHIIANARALVVAGAATGNQAAVTAGMKIFREWLPRLIMGGGFLRERSSHYQLVVLNWLMDAWHFLGAYAGQQSADTQFMAGYTSSMLRAAGMVCGSQGQLLALIGDVSPDATPAQSAARLALLYPGYWPPPAQSPPAVELRDGWFRLSAGRDTVLGNFPADGFPPRFPTHGHCDLSSFVWIQDDTEIVADPGRYRYTRDAVSLFQISGSGHNVPIVNGLAPVCETLVVNGQWWPRPYSEATLEVFERDGGVVLTHTGFARATNVTRHCRQIRAGHGELEVVDSLDGEGTAQVAWCWHFGRSFAAFDPDELVAVGPGGRVKMSVEGVAGAPRAAPIFSDAPGGWISHKYGEKHPALGISLQWNIELPAIVSTRFEPQLCA